MLKVLLSLFALLMFFACADKSPSMMSDHKMFQSVNEKEALLVQDGKDKRYCINCGMDLVKFYKTSHIATTKDGVVKQYCSLHCLSEDLDNGITLKNPKVVDVVSLKLIDATKAFYVVGSDVHGTMSRVSKYAFLNKNDALAFQKEHGGKIMNFYEALEVAKKDFIR